MGYSDVDVIVRVVLSCILGGLIGLERESLNKSAGFRTHILVCVGSSLIMLVSQEIYFQYQGQTTMDPARIAAQVVSGIGFLGAGTIMREGVNVRGLTTAASLWVVAGIGLAVGTGFYFAALVTTGVVFLVLIYLGKVERQMAGMDSYETILVWAANQPGQLGRVGAFLGERKVLIHHIELKQMRDNQQVLFVIVIRLPHGLTVEDIIVQLSDVPGVFQIGREE